MHKAVTFCQFRAYNRGFLQKRKTVSKPKDTKMGYFFGIALMRR